MADSIKRYTVADITNKAMVTAQFDKGIATYTTDEIPMGAIVGFSLALIINANESLLSYDNSTNEIVALGYRFTVLDFDAGILICQVVN
jgi:hypothetical protein